MIVASESWVHALDKIGSNIWAALIGLFGTLLGLLIGLWHTTRASKERRMMELVTSYLNDVYPIEAKALWILEHADPETVTSKQINITRYVGDWFEVYSVMATTGSLSMSLRRKMGIDERVEHFWTTFEHSSVRDKIYVTGGCEVWRNMKTLANR